VAGKYCCLFYFHSFENEMIMKLIETLKPLVKRFSFLSKAPIHKNGIPVELQQAIDACTNEQQLDNLLYYMTLDEAMVHAFDKRYKELEADPLTLKNQSHEANKL
jgi:hypothetical protein